MDYEVAVAAGLLEQDDLLIPSMIIQPYVKNAIKHGITPLQDRKGFIRVSLQPSGNYIDCVVEDAVRLCG